MSSKGLQIAWILPSPTALQAEVRSFARKTGLVVPLEEVRMRALTGLLEDESDCEVCAFGDLVSRACALSRVPVGRIATESQRDELLLRACASLDERSLLRQNAHRPGLRRRLDSTLAELRVFEVEPEDLERAAESVESHDAERLIDLAALSRAFVVQLAEAQRELLTDRMESVMQQDADLTLMGRVLVVAGSTLRPRDLRFLSWLVERGAQVNALFEASGERGFEGARSSASSLAGKIDPPKDHWTASLFGDGTAADTPEVEIVSAPDSLSECEWALRRCLDAIGQGTLPHRIGLIVRNSDVYRPLLSVTAERFGVPLDTVVRVPLDSNSLVKWVVQTVSTLADEQPRGMLDVARSSYLGLEEGQLADLELALLGCRESDDPWLVLEQAQDLPEPVRALLAWRSGTRMEPVPERGWCDRLRRLLEVEPLPDRAFGQENPTRERDLRAKNTLERSMAELSAVAGPQPRTLEQWATRLRAVAGDADTTLPNPGPAGVQVVASPEALGPCDLVMVLEMLEGTLPKRRSEDPILPDALRSAINAARPGLPVLPDSFSTAREERDAFVRLCCAPRQKLVLSFPQTSDERDNVPAFYLTEIKRLLGDEVKTTDHSRSLIVPPEDECRTLTDLAIRTALKSPRRFRPSIRLTHELAKDSVRAPLESGVEPGEYGAAAECPFRAAFRYRLGVYDRWGDEARRRLARLPIRAGLVVAPDPETARSWLEQALTELLVEIGASYPAAQVVLVEAEARRLIDGWIEREFLARDRWGVQPDRVRREATLGEDGLINQLNSGGSPVRWTGTLTGLTNVGGHRVAHIFSLRDQAPIEKQRQGGTEENPPADTLSLGLIISSLLADTRRAALVVDAPSGRTFYRFPKLPENAVEPLRSDTNLHVREFDAKTLGEIVQALRKKAVERMRRADAEAVPGQWCQHCAYGEICRSSTEFHDAASPFDALLGGSEE